MSALEKDLGRLHSGLEGLLSCLESQPLAEKPVLDSAWGEVHRAFERVRSQLQGLALDGTERDAVQERVEHCMRLQAVAAGIAARRRDELVIEQRLCSEARQRVRAQESAGRCGDSCDLSG